MTITEFANIVFKSPLDFSDPALGSLLRKLSVWQSECSGFPLRFFTSPGKPDEVCLVTGWTSVAAHEAWIRGSRNQELLRVFAPYIDMQRVRMVHLGVDFEAMPSDAVGCAGASMVVERYESSVSFESGTYASSLVGRNLGQDDNGDVYVFRFGGRGVEVENKVAPVERWTLERANV